jgi:hypothetical protein
VNDITTIQQSIDPILTTGDAKQQSINETFNSNGLNETDL